jgi:Fur family transcriptional regulator, ferric uptake regulator
MKIDAILPLAGGQTAMKTPAAQYDVAWAKGILKTAGLRSTAARVAVLQRLAIAHQPTSHADVVQSLQNFAFDQSTIFRALQELCDAGVVNRLELGDQVRRFELRGTAGTDELEHPHFMCVDCGKVTCLEEFSFNLSPSRGPRREQLGEITEVLLKGHCGDCVQAS